MRKSVGEYHLGHKILGVYSLKERERSKKKYRNRYHYRLECSCGKYFSSPTSRKKLRSTQCMDCKFKGMITHGKSGHRLYTIRTLMRGRCSEGGKYYERGIRLCEDRKDFKAFYRRAQRNGYRNSVSIDRVDNDGDYKPSNCRRATPKQQARNTSRNRKYKGKLIIERCEQVGLKYQTFYARVRRGRSVEEAIFGKRKI